MLTVPRINIAWSRIYNTFLVIDWQNGPFKVCPALYQELQVHTPIKLHFSRWYSSHIEQKYVQRCEMSDMESARPAQTEKSGTMASMFSRFCCCCPRPKPKATETERKVKAHDPAFNEKFNYAVSRLLKILYNFQSFRTTISGRRSIVCSVSSRKICSNSSDVSPTPTF